MPALVVRSGPRAGFQYDLLPGRPRVRLGRLGSNQLQILDKKASREHAEIVFEDKRFEIRDLGSRNGTYVNGVRLEEPHLLEPGDRISIGDFILDYVEEAPQEVEEAEDVAEVEFVATADDLDGAEGLEVLGPADAAEDAKAEDAKAQDAKAKEDVEELEEAEYVTDSDEDLARTVAAGEGVSAAAAPAGQEPAKEAPVKETSDKQAPRPKEEPSAGGDEGQPDEEDADVVFDVKPGGLEVLGPAEDEKDEDDEEVVEVAEVESVDDVEGLEVLKPIDDEEYEKDG